MDFDYDIIKSFIPEEERKHFLVFENVYTSGSKILAPYRTTWRSTFSEKLSIDISEYESRLKQKQREVKLNQLV
jgi:hypothetical protein